MKPNDETGGQHQTLQEQLERARLQLQEVHSRKWYRVIGYRSSWRFFLVVVALVLMFVGRPRPDLFSVRGITRLALILAFAALAIWDLMDWRNEHRLAQQALTEASQALAGRAGNEST